MEQDRPNPPAATEANPLPTVLPTPTATAIPDKPVKHVVHTCQGEVFGVYPVD